MKNSLDNKINQYFDEQIPEPSKDKFEEILDKVKKQESHSKQTRKGFLRWGLSIACCLIIITISILLPFIIKRPEASPTPYYASDDVTEVILSEEYVKRIIDDKYEKYNVLFEKCTLNYSGGYYTKDTNTLVGLSLTFSKENEPYTIITFELVMNNNFKLKNDLVYTEDSKVTTAASYTLYEKESCESEEMIYYKLFKYDNYKLYLTMDENDLDIFIHFL